MSKYACTKCKTNTKDSACGTCPECGSIQCLDARYIGGKLQRIKSSRKRTYDSFGKGRIANRGNRVTVKCSCGRCNSTARVDNG